MTQNAFAVVDLFAGPGGLAEGFSSFRASDGSQPFRVVLSVEKDPIAHRTLRLRSFLRQFPAGFPHAYYQWIEQAGDEPDWEHLYPVQWHAACEEAQNVTMGVVEDDAVIARRLTAIRRRHGDRTIVIGGPPCQAYSLVGRSRNKGKADYVFEEDHRHELYKAYVDVLKRLRPAAFVMENVKGLLSSKANGDFLFHRVLADLRQPGGKSSGYRLISLASGGAAGIDPAPSDFVIRAEKHGIPQARHRLFIVGLREDIASELDDVSIMSAQLKEERDATVRHVLSGLAKVRSGLSRRDDDADEWKAEVLATFTVLGKVRLSGPASQTKKFQEP
jgi:DNA (cytosine-5)-methyltransferase 1